MKRILIGACSAVLAGAAAAAAQTTAPTALPSPPLVAPRRVIIENQPPSSFFPNADQQTGVWQGCGPAGSQGNLEDFSHAHPRARIVQVFIDASIPCKASGAHTFLIVYQEQGEFARRSIRKPMSR